MFYIMLDLLKKKKIEKELNQSYETKFKHYPSSVREWNNSIYLYNKNNLSLIPCTTAYVMKIIQSFFSFYNKSLDKKTRTKKLLFRLRRFSSNRIYLSNGEFKHKNNSVLINIYIFNRQKSNYLIKIKKIFLKRFLNHKTNKSLHIKFINLLKSIHIKGLNDLKLINNSKYSLLETLNILNKNYKIDILKNLSNYTLYYYKKVLNLTIKRLRLYFLYKQLIYINRSKLNYTYLRVLKKHLEKLYNKNVEFNLINLKRFYLNSDIFTEAVKLKIARNKLHMRMVFKKFKDKVKVHKKNLYLDKDSSPYLNLSKKNELKKINNINLLKVIFNNLKYKHITGFKLQANGRLSRRFTASRSVKKIEQKGKLFDIDSSYKRISTVILKGNLKSNMQYTSLNSRTRIGSFGVRGWISGN